MTVTDALVIALLYPEEEFFVPVPDYLGYEISNWGRVRSFWNRVSLGGRLGSYSVLCDRPQNFLKPIVDARDGRLYYCLYLSGKKCRRQVAAWLLLAFEGPRPGPRWHAAHRNGVATDNRLPNLYWATKSENVIDSVLHGTHCTVRLRPEDIPVIRARLAAGETQVSIAKTYGVTDVTISLIKRGIRWAHIPA